MHIFLMLLLSGLYQSEFPDKNMPFYSENLLNIDSVMHEFCKPGDHLPKQDVIFLDQRHGSAVIQVDRSSSNSKLSVSGDSIFSVESCSVGLVTADCIPILVASTNESFVGAIHAGWKGLKDDIIANSINAYREAGVSISHLAFAMGPCIHKCCFEVGHSLMEEVQLRHGHLWKHSAPPWSKFRNLRSFSFKKNLACGSTDSYWFDLSAYTKILLLDSGVALSQLREVPNCTYCSPDRLGSFRRRNHNFEPVSFQRSWIGHI